MMLGDHHSLWHACTPGTGRVHLAHPSPFACCLQLRLEWADGKLILLHSNPGMAALTKNNITVNVPAVHFRGLNKFGLKQEIPTNLKNLEYRTLARMKKKKGLFCNSRVTQRMSELVSNNLYIMCGLCVFLSPIHSLTKIASSFPL